MWILRYADGKIEEMWQGQIAQMSNVIRLMNSLYFLRVSGDSINLMKFDISE